MKQMKKNILMFLFLGIMSLSVSCIAETDSKVGVILRGNHKLIPLLDFPDIKFVTGITGITGVTKDNITSNTCMVVNNDIAMFVWIGNNNETLMSSLPVGKIRIEYSTNSQNSPSIKFRWAPYNLIANGDIEGAMKKVIYAVITLKKDMKLEKLENE